jgi:predicted AAA+ superfamily ATPase
LPGKKDFDFVRIAQNAIYQNYIADMAKYSTPADAIKTIAVYDSIPVQLAKENKKFPYRLIKSGVRASAYEFSMDWLKKAGVIISCNKITEGQVSLDYYKDQSSYKIYLSDVGLLTGKSNLPASLILADSSIGSGVKGALTENYVAQELVAGGHIPFY